MTALADVAAGAGGALVWKAATLVLLAALLAGGGAGGALWWSAAAARDNALADLAAEKNITAQLRAGVDDQNRAVQQWYQAAQAASMRGAAAQQQVAAAGQRYDAALAQLAGAKATSCADAMPYVNKMLESLR